METVPPQLLSKSSLATGRNLRNLFCCSGWEWLFGLHPSTPFPSQLRWHLWDPGTSASSTAAGTTWHREVTAKFRAESYNVIIHKTDAKRIKKKKVNDSYAKWKPWYFVFCFFKKCFFVFCFFNKNNQNCHDMNTPPSPSSGPWASNSAGCNLRTSTDLKWLKGHCMRESQAKCQGNPSICFVFLAGFLDWGLGDGPFVRAPVGRLSARASYLKTLRESGPRVALSPHSKFPPDSPPTPRRRRPPDTISANS